MRNIKEALITDGKATKRFMVTVSNIETVYFENNVTTITFKSGIEKAYPYGVEFFNPLMEQLHDYCLTTGEFLHVFGN